METAALDLKKFYKKRVRNILQILDKDPCHFSDETVHQLRVEIKKIKATFHMVVALNKKFDAAYYLKPFRALFKAAGKLRTIEIDRQLIATYDLDGEGHEYMKTLSDSKERARNKFHETIRSERRDKAIKLQKQKVVDVLSGISAKDIQKQLSDDSKSLRRLFSKKIFREDELHIVRKNLKRFYLVSKKTLPAQTAGELNTFLELLGKWHDRKETFLHLMKFAFSPEVEGPERQRLNEIKSKILSDKESLFDQVVSRGLLDFKGTYS
jgi:CHAD domain-containing protein